MAGRLAFISKRLPSERATAFSVNRPRAGEVWVTDYLAASTGGLRAVEDEMAQAWQLYQKERLLCGCAPCLEELGLKPQEAPDAAT